MRFLQSREIEKDKAKKENDTICKACRTKKHDRKLFIYVILQAVNVPVAQMTFSSAIKYTHGPISGIHYRTKKQTYITDNIYASNIH